MNMLLQTVARRCEDTSFGACKQKLRGRGDEIPEPEVNGGSVGAEGIRRRRNELQPVFLHFGEARSTACFGVSRVFTGTRNDGDAGFGEFSRNPVTPVQIGGMSRGRG